MKKILFLLTTLSVLSCSSPQEREKKSFEEGYFEGQVNALSGDIRVFKTPGGCWVWSKPLWRGANGDEWASDNPYRKCLEKHIPVELKE